MKTICVFLLIFFVPLHASQEQLSIDEQVGQLLVAHFNGKEANDDAKTLIQQVHVGGIIYYNWANELNSPKQVRNLSQGLQKLATIPLLIVLDQEGGRVCRLKNGFTCPPPNRELGDSGNLQKARWYARTVGQELRDVGVNVNLAPVVDVAEDPQSYMRLRSFGNDPKIVANFGLEALSGYEDANIIATLKHYPGHGNVSADSHEKLPVLQKTRAEMDAVDLYPFRKLIESTSVPAIMTAHILVPELDRNWCATLSPKILGILRNEWNYGGVIIADSLVMEGVLNQTGTVEEAALQAFLAGCDILMLGGKVLVGDAGSRELSIPDVVRIHKYLVQAVKDGRIPLERLQQSVNRILFLKKQTVLPSEGGEAAPP